MLREEIERAGFTQGQFASEIGIERPLINKIVVGAILPNVSTAQKMCKTLKRPILSLFDEKDINLSECGAEFASCPCIQAKIHITSKRKEVRTAKKLTIRLSDYAARAFSPEVLAASGFRNQTELIHAVARWLLDKYEKEGKE